MSERIIEITDYEERAVSIINEILGEKGQVKLARRSDSYLSLIDDIGNDFCRVKVSERTSWMSVDMWVCSESLKNDDRLKNVANKNQRHWKIQIFGIDDIKNYADFIVNAFRSEPDVPNITGDDVETKYTLKPASGLRPYKGISLISFPDDFTVIDLETTGFSSEYDEIIEFAGIKVRNGEVTDTMQTLIKPKGEVSEYITALTGITNDMLADAPALIDVLLMIRAFIGDDYIVGHNVNFDINFLYDALYHNIDTILNNDYIDTCRIARILLPELPHHRLCDIVKALNVPENVFHRALCDCQSTLDCYKAMKLMDYSGNVASVVRRNVTDLREIVTDKKEFDISNPLYGKKVVFTGVLQGFTRTEAAQLVVDLGGTCQNDVTKTTNYLVLGNNDYCMSIKDGKSFKQKKAEAYKLKGCDIEIIPESVFNDLING